MRFARSGKADIGEFLAELSKTKNAATVERVFRLLHRVLEVAVEEDQLRRNPAHGVKVPDSRRREARFLTEQEIGAIASQVPERYRALVWTLAISGLRIGEASGFVELRGDDLDRFRATVPDAEPPSHRTYHREHESRLGVHCASNRSYPIWRRWRV